MKLTKLINSAHIVAWINSMPKITPLHTANNNKSSASIDTAVNSEILSSYSTNLNYLKPFDTAFIAYYMMGFSNFERSNPHSALQK
ncbi:hypothetical protein GTQ43_07750 [Nostoc sp. KVJ3]|uniref:hypothetical protein n=1 Tax=Nostoc sp. KVJ3 TaxID=457945 RepID=UPI002237B4B1|nr:hypothetical protein [Nostoc sp. KVJ3]MCW5313703.1 hypothetical protein [Nostoc sp. KVJ3]